MAFSDSTMSLHSPSSGRIRELSRLYSFTGTPLTPETQSSPGHFRNRDRSVSDTAASLTSDITLKALNQLGLYRFNCTHSFTCLTLEQRRHIIAEASNSVSCGKGRQSRDSGIDFGGDSGSGLSLNAALPASRDQSSVFDITDSTAKGECCIILDMSKDDSFKSHPHAAQWPHMRFFAEVPLYDPERYVLGTYCIMDDSPRAVFDNADIEALRGIAESIAHHLWTQHKYSRASRMMSGLSTLVQSPGDEKNEFQRRGSQAHVNVLSGGNRDEGGTSGVVPLLSPTGRLSDAQEVDSAPIPTPGEVSPCTMRPQPSEDNEVTPTAPPQKQKEPETKFNLPSPLPFGEFSDSINRAKTTEDSRRASRLISVSEAPTISQQILTLFARASSLLRECLDIEGVLFLDASRSNTRRNSCISTSMSDTSQDTTHTDTSSHPPRSPGLSSDSIWSSNVGRLCDVLGFDLDETSVKSASTPAFGFTDGLIYDIITAFPHGEIFNVHEQESQEGDGEPGFPGFSARSQLISQLRSRFPSAESILFFPLWDWNKSGWLAACLLWSRESGRFSTEELDYLKAFGNSVVSQVAQTDFTTKERAKSDFISSISHELRSPLHGVLASTELLQSTRLQPAQQDMIRMVETCGITLLDTMNYLLDFAKINNLTAVNAKGKAPDLATTFDLDSLIEEVTNSLYAGHRFPKSVDQATGRFRPGSVGSSQESVSEAKAQEKLSVVVRLEEQDAWCVRSVSGAWRRIVMNLFGNALKFTKAGFIEMTLSRSDIASDPKHVLAHLSVTDTGCGISPDFLENRIFTPFSQEDILSEGVGLGLSIVQQLVTSLGGYVEVKSEVGVGSQFDVFIPIQRPCASMSTAQVSGDKQPKKVSLVGFNPYDDLKKGPAGMLTTNVKRKLALRRSLSSIILTQPGWMVSFADSLSNASGDMAIIEEDKLREIAANGPIRTGFGHIIILGEYGTPFDSDDIIKKATVVHVTQPIGPRKILEALKKARPSPQEHVRETKPAKMSTLVHQSSMKKHPLSNVWTAKSSPSPPPPEKKASQNDLHVLIVDDNDINLKILETFMRKLGTSYESATNGQIAVDKYQQSERRFDYILMDISMPVMDGITASAKIREYEQEKSFPPSVIMAVTGVASAATQQQAFDAGINDYLVKPISLHELKRMMNIK